MLGKLGKGAAEIALQFLADGMPLKDAVRAGSKLMDEAVDVEKLLARDTKALQNNAYARVAENADILARSDYGKPSREYAPFGSPMRRYRAKEKAFQAEGMDDYAAIERENRRLWQEQTKIAAARKYTIRQLLDAASGGDPNVAAMLAQRLGFEGVL